MNHIACSECSITICLSDEALRTLKRTGHQFYCINGHGQVFNGGKTQLEVELAEARDEWKESAESWRTMWEEEQMKAAEARRLARTCPLCGEVMKRSRSRLANHLFFDHGAAVGTTHAEDPA